MSPHLETPHKCRLSHVSCNPLQNEPVIYRHYEKSRSKPAWYLNLGIPEGAPTHQWHLSLPTHFNTGITDLYPETTDAGDVDLSPHAFPFTEPLPQSLGDLLQ